MGESTGAGSNTNNVVVELKDVASVKGFGSTFGDGTIVSSTVTNLTNATIDLAALATSSNLDYTGFAIDDGFVVGYGLDCNEQDRSLPEVYVIKE